MTLTIRQYWNLLARYLRRQRAHIIWLTTLVLGNIGLQLLNPQIMRRFLDAAMNGTGSDTLPPLAILFIGVALVQQLVAVGATYFGENVGWTATNMLRYDLARHCLNLDMSFHNEHTPGEMIERIDGDINALSNFFSQFVLQILGNGLLLLGVLILLFQEHLTIGGAMTLFVAITLFVINRLRNAAVPFWQQAREAIATFFGFLEERLSGTEDIRASGAKAYVMRRFFELLRAAWQTTVRARLLASALINASWVLFSIGTALAFILGANLYQSGVLSLASVYLIVHYTSMLSRPIERISQEIERLQEAGAGVVRVQELMTINPRLDPVPSSPIPLPPGPLAVSFQQATFAYQTQNPDDVERRFALNDISFCLEPGRVLGLLGRTGSGKTTLTRLLLRLYDPDSGSVSLNQTDLRQIALPELRHRVGMVTQNIQLFHASVRENLTFFDPSIREADILRALDSLGLTGWLEKLEGGLDTILSAGGESLSAGEAQLLAFTRIFLKDPGLIILDEASSRLDPATEQLIEQAIDKLLHNRTAIIIAHRLATVQRADEIIILDQGRIQEQGLRSTLIADSDSHFSHMLQRGLEALLV